MRVIWNVIDSSLHLHTWSLFISVSWPALPGAWLIDSCNQSAHGHYVSLNYISCNAIFALESEYLGCQARATTSLVLALMLISDTHQTRGLVLREGYRVRNKHTHSPRPERARRAAPKANARLCIYCTHVRQRGSSAFKGLNDALWWETEGGLNMSTWLFIRCL